MDKFSSGDRTQDLLFFRQLHSHCVNEVSTRLSQHRIRPTGYIYRLSTRALEIMIHTVVLIAYQEGKIRSKGHQSANYSLPTTVLQVYNYMGITFRTAQI